jgi:hypothetical protein
MLMKAVKAAAALALVAVSSKAWAALPDSTTGSGPMAKYAAAIRKIESTNRYHITANAGRGRTALGAYQILDANLASWSRAALGRSVSQAEFLRSPHLQDRIFHHRFGHYVKKYGPHGAARAWLGGEGVARGGGGGADRFGSTPSSYAAKFARAARS